jgi:NAD(P)-dependent dehydrogenase (short-subunit alcohol dehydrogenase family)
MSQKHTIIIGGTRGLGRALVSLFAEEDRLLSIVGRRNPSESDKQIPNARYWQLNLADIALLEKTLTEIVHENGKVANLVFFQRYRDKGDDWTGEIETSLTATQKTIEILKDNFDPDSAKSIVIVSSVASNLIAEEQPLSYHVGKAGLHQMVRFYAVKLGDRGIRVNSIAPGTILKEESQEFYLQNEPLQSLYRSIIPLGRMGTSQEVANTIAFLCSTQASYITGQNLVVDGGLSLQWQESLARKVVSLNNPSLARPKS